MVGAVYAPAMADDLLWLDATAQAVLGAARRMENAADALLAHRDGGAPA